MLKEVWFISTAPIGWDGLDAMWWFGSFPPHRSLGMARRPGVVRMRMRREQEIVRRTGAQPRKYGRICWLARETAMRHIAVAFIDWVKRVL